MNPYLIQNSTFNNIEQFMLHLCYKYIFFKCPQTRISTIFTNFRIYNNIEQLFVTYIFIKYFKCTQTRITTIYTNLPHLI